MTALNRQAAAVAIGHRVANLRNAAQMSQAQLSEKSGIHRHVISRIENGRHTPSVPVLVVLGKALGCSAAWIVQSVDELVGELEGVSP